MAIKMKTSLSGIDFALAPGDVTAMFDADEEARLIAADFAETADALPAAETADKPKATAKTTKPKSSETR